MKITQSYKDKLNQLWVSNHVHHQNLRMLHWNNKGDKLIQLHTKYEELYTRTQTITDDLAIGIIALVGTPLQVFCEYIQHSFFAESQVTSEGNQGIQYAINAQNDLMVVEVELLKLLNLRKDEGTNALIFSLIKEK